MPPLAGGSGEAFSHHIDARLIGAQAVILALLTAWLAPVLLAALIVIPAIAAYWRHRLGGITGDCLGASVEVSAFLSVASKGAALALLLRVLMVIAGALNYQNAPAVSLTAIAVVIGILGSVTATVGNLAAFVQTNIKRLLAYSSIAHAGYMLCALSLVIQHDRAPAR